MANKRTNKGGFYAVRSGREIGVFKTWAECEKHTKGFANARFKKFASKKEAEEYAMPDLSEQSNTATSSSTASPATVIADSKGKKRAFPVVQDEAGWDVVYSDGACKGNGKRVSRGGIGVWWGPDDPRNLAEPCPGEQTNNRAELIAILRVLETTPISKKPLLIKTDSQYSINSFQSWIHSWKRNNWRTAQGEPVKNAGIIRCVSKYLDIRSRSGQRVHLQYVKGHSGDVGNDGADEMANRGVLLPQVKDRDWDALEHELSRKFDQIGIGRKDSESVPTEVYGLDDSGESDSNEPPASKIRKLSPTNAMTGPKISGNTPTLLSKGIDSIAETKKASSQVPTSQYGKITSALNNALRFVMPTAPSPLDAVRGKAKPVIVNFNHPDLLKSDTSKVMSAGPPSSPVTVDEIDINDYEDCVLDDFDLANELSD
ncbi:ribonuclease H-like domain-containing protein [Crassisporium funariophilum]|nr:ribonuclease H-like domain-containing protein [Crassisporium funariophilum]